MAHQNDNRWASSYVAGVHASGISRRRENSKGALLLAAGGSLPELLALRRVVLGGELNSLAIFPELWRTELMFRLNLSGRVTVGIA